jgi:hypothetical protein
MDNLKNLSTSEIKKLWNKYLKTALPKLKRPMLIKYIYWYQQAKEHKINLNAYFNSLEKESKNCLAGKERKEDIVFEVGTKLVRSYKGEKYEVEVIKEGFVYKSEVYKSLSAIARKITGVQWNGRLFFRGESGRYKKAS